MESLLVQTADLELDWNKIFFVAGVFLGSSEFF